MTIIFNTFVFLCFFNEFNCRVVGASDFNVFTKFFNNWIFIACMAFIFIVQWCVCSGLNSWIFSTTVLTAQEFWTCVIWGSTSLLASVLLKLTPESFVDKIPVTIDDNKAIGEDSRIMKIYKTASKS